jgi:hypothetical protein
MIRLSRLGVLIALSLLALPGTAPAQTPPQAEAKTPAQAQPQTAVDTQKRFATAEEAANALTEAIRKDDDAAI